MQSLLQWFRHFKLRYFHKVAHERVLYRQLWKRPLTKLVLLGVGDGQRAWQLIDLLKARTPERIELVGVDLFEMRPNATLTLKEAHRRLSATGAKIRLLPGDPFSALAAHANGLGGTQLLLISAGQDEESLAKAWFYVPRMLGPEATVLVEQPQGESGQMTWRTITAAELEQLAARPRPRRAA